jgi:glutaredoxin
VFVIYSKPNCPACDQAKALLTSKDLPYKEITLDIGQQKTPDREYIQRDQLLSLFPGARTVPQIKRMGAAGPIHIGGFPELRQHLTS